MIKERKNLLKSLYALLPSFLLQLHQFSVKRLIKRERFFFITNFRWSLNVEVARLPIVCFDAINRHTFFFLYSRMKNVIYCSFQWAPRACQHVYCPSQCATTRANETERQKWEGNFGLGKMKHKNNKQAKGRVIGYTLMIIWIMIAGCTQESNRKY